nr:hypothetical protein [Acidobacteriota bacterium]
RHGSTQHVHDDEQQTVFARVLGSQTVFIVFNNDTKSATIEFDASEADVTDGARLIDRLEVLSGETRVAGGRVRATLPARSASILVARER